MSAITRLMGSPDRPAAEAAGPGPSSVEDRPAAKTVTKTAAQAAREVLAGIPALIAECRSIASGLEKTAEEGGIAFLEKIATALEVQEKHAASLLEQAVENARVVEALKLASTLVEDDRIEIPADESLYDFVSHLSTKDLSVVKQASEMISGGFILGEAEKTAGAAVLKGDGSRQDWEAAHDWLMKA